MRYRAAVPAIAIVCVVAIAGCGLGAGGPTSGAVTLTVTRGFGTAPVGSVSEQSIPGSQTVMRMLERSFKVTTRYSGGFVESIDGHAGSGSHLDWFYYVNGVQASLGASGTSVHKGDRIWWDLHDWTATDSVPAVVGSFPEPFVHGIGGRRYPVTIQCATDADMACKRVTSELKSTGVPVSSQAIGGGSGTDSIGVVVGTWNDVHGELLAELIDHGPASSGVYARFSSGGSSLQLLNPDGNVVRTLGAGAGLIAATAQPSTGPFWLITGTNVAGVSAAAAALTPGRLRNHFALAVQGQSDFPVPLEGAS
ncbi:MAG TPA: DUF4430 domain-containing protein [Solirubrobacteraceae bacterium]|nr:DUF4430 domain-containing protein [Solirubrobacteraceae bacterium]